MSLFRKLPSPDRQQTQLAYRIKYWPWHELAKSARELVNYRQGIYLKVKQLELACNLEMTKLTLSRREWLIVWAYNNIPTEVEWAKQNSERLIRVELRCSVAIPEHAVAILSFELPSERLKAVAAGELSAGYEADDDHVDNGMHRRHSDFVPFNNRD